MHPDLFYLVPRHHEVATSVEKPEELSPVAKDQRLNPSPVVNMHVRDGTKAPAVNNAYEVPSG